MKTQSTLKTNSTTSAIAETALESTSKMFRTTYSVAVNWLKMALVMCNHIWEIDETTYENVRFNPFDEEGNAIDIFQAYITNCDHDDVEYLEEHFGLLFTYSELLDCFILCVDHYGTSWDYVMINTDLEEAKAERGTTTKK